MVQWYHWYGDQNIGITGITNISLVTVIAGSTGNTGSSGTKLINEKLVNELKSAKWLKCVSIATSEIGDQNRVSPGMAHKYCFLLHL